MPYGPNSRLIRALLYTHTSKTTKVSVFLCYYGLKFSRSICQSVRRRMNRLSANQILAFYPYFVWYTIISGILLLHFCLNLQYSWTKLMASRSTVTFTRTCSIRNIRIRFLTKLNSITSVVKEIPTFGIDFAHVTDTPKCN